LRLQKQGKIISIHLYCKMASLIGKCLHVPLITIFKLFKRFFVTDLPIVSRVMVRVGSAVTHPVGRNNFTLRVLDLKRSVKDLQLYKFFFVYRINIWVAFDSQSCRRRNGHNIYNFYSVYISK